MSSSAGTDRPYPSARGSIVIVRTNDDTGAAFVRRPRVLTITVSIEVDPMIAERARATLAAAGYSPLMITGDGTDGYPDAAPYGRVLATAAVRSVLATGASKQSVL
jgi:hypothetical protein